jgi:cation:H+ antiporter
MDLALGGWVVVFVAAALVVGVGGTILARMGDAIAKETGLGGLTVGLLLLSLATSLPEVATSTSAAATGAPDLAVSNYLGSNMANMAVLAIVDLLSRRKVFPLIELAQARVGTGAVVLTAVVGLAILLQDGRTIGPIGYDTVIITVTFLAILTWIRRAPAEIRGLPVSAVGGDASINPGVPGAGDGTGIETHGALAVRDRRRLRRALLGFGIGALVTLAAAPVLAIAAQEIARLTGIGQTFVGAAFLAMATSAPELVASVAAVRIGAADLAVGNLFGSNLFNMGIIFTADLAYPGGAILASVSPVQNVVAFGAIILTGLGLAAVLHGTETRPLRIEPDALLILVVYLVLLAITAGGLG